MLGLRMPKKVQPSHPFGLRLTELRRARGLTQTALAETIGSTQRAISAYETVIALPPTHVVIALAKALDVSTDVLLGLETKAQKKTDVPREDPETRRLWKRFQPLLSLPEKDRWAVLRLVSSLLQAKRTTKRSAA